MPLLVFYFTAMPSPIDSVTSPMCTTVHVVQPEPSTPEDSTLPPPPTVLRFIRMVLNTIAEQSSLSKIIAITVFICSFVFVLGWMFQSIHPPEGCSRFSISASKCGLSELYWPTHDSRYDNSTPLPMWNTPSPPRNYTVAYPLFSTAEKCKAWSNNKLCCRTGRKRRYRTCSIGDACMFHFVTGVYGCLQNPSPQCQQMNLCDVQFGMPYGCCCGRNPKFGACNEKLSPIAIVLYQ